MKETKRRFRNVKTGVEGVLIKRVSRTFFGDTFIIQCDDGRQYYAPAKEFVSL